MASKGLSNEGLMWLSIGIIGFFSLVALIGILTTGSSNKLGGTGN